MKTQLLICPTSFLQLHASANVSRNNSAMVTFSQAEGDLMRNVPSLHPIPSRTRSESLAISVSQCVPSGFTGNRWAQGTVQLVTQRAREALNDQRATARRVLRHQQEEFLAATHQYVAVAKQNLVSALARNNKTHNYVSSTARTSSRYAICSKTEGTVISISPGSKSSS